MAEKEQQSPYPIPPAANGYSRSNDTEAAAAHYERELRKKKRTKCLLYIVLFIIFQTAIITLFALTVMKVRTPEFRVREARIANFNSGTQTNPSLSARLNAQISVKNTNFGRYKYRSTTVQFLYRGMPIGEVYMPNSRANWRSTRKFNVAVDLNLANAQANSQLSSDFSAGIIPITVQSKLRGRVELMFVMKKNRATEMSCTLAILTATPQIANIVCK